MIERARSQPVIEEITVLPGVTEVDADVRVAVEEAGFSYQGAATLVS